MCLVLIKHGSHAVYDHELTLSGDKVSVYHAAGSRSVTIDDKNDGHVVGCLVVEDAPHEARRPHVCNRSPPVLRVLSWWTRSSHTLRGPFYSRTEVEVGEDGELERSVRAERETWLVRVRIEQQR